MKLFHDGKITIICFTDAKDRDAFLDHVRKNEGLYIAMGDSSSVTQEQLQKAIKKAKDRIENPKPQGEPILEPATAKRKTVGGMVTHLKCYLFGHPTDRLAPQREWYGEDKSKTHRRSVFCLDCGETVHNTGSEDPFSAINMYQGSK